MAKPKSVCPLCGSVLPSSRYLKIVGVWDARSKLEADLQRKLTGLAQERRQLLDERRRIRRQSKIAEAEAMKKGQEKEKKRTEKLSRMIQGKAKTIQDLNAKIKELEEQLKRGSTPQEEGLNFEKDLVKELRKTFPDDKIEHFGKAGDIMHGILFKNKIIASILYECKKTTKFSNSYVAQTKRAVAQRKATYGILVTFAPKRGTAGFWVEKDIIVVHPFGVVHVAQLLRHSLVELNSIRVRPGEIEKRAKLLLEFIKGDSFKNSVEDSIYRTRMVYDILKKEIKSHTNIWKSRYSHYNALHENLSAIKISTSNILRGQSEKIKEIKQLPPAPKIG